MSLHTTLIVIIVTKENTNLLAHGFAKYQLAENDFKIIRWKYFCPFNKPQAKFSIECGEFTYFEAECYQYNSHTNSKNVYMKLRIFYPTNVAWFSYLGTNSSIKIGRLFIVSGFVSYINSDFVIFEVTYVDFITSNINIALNVQPSITLNDSEHRSDIDMIAENTDFNIL
ncbi:5611_t:CDS:2 [Gigaspora margarita]|uniref:5611_t:CDS:1 n=1 Tax=Gigaspora margarita TaxID=4874 RepID=A0ABN7WM42_GIGMA|nr:5611_t:CDS:2 [Gigaspora margarita]